MSISANRARCLVAVAAILWSMGSLFTRTFQTDTFLQLQTPVLDPMHFAIYRSLFAGLAMVVLLRGVKKTINRSIVGMVITFAMMNITYILAIALGKASHAILLQNAAPLWVFLFSVWVLKESSKRRDVIALGIGMLGIAALLLEGFLSTGEADWRILCLGVLSGLAYAGVILFLRHLRNESPPWLTFMNHFGAGVLMAIGMIFIYSPGAWWEWITRPSLQQMLFLAFWGTVQMALPYILFARGMKLISAQEAGTIALLEPILNPVWAWLITPERERFTLATWISAAMILGALAYRYWPVKRVPTRNDETS